MPPNKSNDIINSFFTLPHTCSAVRFLDIDLSSLPYQKKKQKFQTPYFLNLFTTAGETASSMYSAILNGVVGVHIDKRAFSRDQRYLILIGQYVLERYLSATMDKRVARSANQNPDSVEFVEEFRLKRDLMNIQLASLATSSGIPHMRSVSSVCVQKIKNHKIEFGNEKG